jgi:2-phosphoglycerate kinase
MTEPRHREPLPLGGDGIPYSKGLMARALTATGVKTVQAYELALRIEADLHARGERTVEFDRAQELAVEVLGREVGERAIDRVRRYRDLQELDVPIVILVGGGTGTGKSTVATEVAYRLGITRVTSTDFIRQTMRAFFAKDFMPSIHYSSFEADAAVSQDESDPVVRGFLDQTRNVLVGVDAALDRARQEGWSMVLEGVHIVPGMVPAELEGAIFVQCVLSIQHEAAHASHFTIRDALSDGVRPVAKYVDRLPEIRRIQDLILERARRTDIPVIENTSLEDTAGKVMELVLASAERLERVG